MGEALARAGLTVHRQVGTSRFRIDLAVVHPAQPGRYILGIECDGKTYHQSKTARDRDRLRQEILEGLGWTIHRIWSTDWVRQPDRELNKVMTRVDELLHSPAADPPPEGADAVVQDDGGDAGEVIDLPDAIDARRVDERELGQVGVPYTIAQVRAPYGGYGDILSVGAHLLAEVVTACVEVEGPIHRDLLLRRVTVGLGHQRAGTRIAAHLDTAIGIAVQRGAIRRHGAFLDPMEERPVVVRGPATDGTVREIGHIPDEEIMAGMRSLVERAFSLSHDELVARTSRLFGFQRTGSDIRMRLEAVVERAVNDGELEVLAERYQLPRR